jgi:hypothetical protein
VIRRLLLPAGLLALAVPSGLGAQDLSAALERRADRVPDGKGAWQETWLVPRSGAVAAGAGDTEFGGRVQVRHDEGRERIEIRRVVDGKLGPPMVVVGDDDGYWLVTRVGAVPFAGSDPARDPFVGLVLAGPPGAAPPHRTVPATGGIAAVVLRHPLPADFDDDAFAIRRTALSGDRIAGGLSSFSAAGDAEVVASAGARGVEQVRTANGTVAVTPDSAAVAWMETQAPSAVDAETFKLESGLAPYDALPADAGGGEPAGDAPGADPAGDAPTSDPAAPASDPDAQAPPAAPGAGR